jgi:hypothetical protein
VAWARAHREDFLLLFHRLPSKRKGLGEEVPMDSPYQVVAEAVKRAHEGAVVKAPSKAAIERLAYGLWATAHGMAMLQLSHLAHFKADFEAADRQVFESLIDGWS